MQQLCIREVTRPYFHVANASQNESSSRDSLCKLRIFHLISFVANSLRSHSMEKIGTAKTQVAQNLHSHLSLKFTA